LVGQDWFYYGMRYGVYRTIRSVASEDAEEFLSANLEANPSSAMSYATLAEAYVDAGNFDAAIGEYRHALELQPNSAAIHRGIATTLWSVGKKADAIRDYQALLADSAPDAPWRSMVNAHLAALNGAPAPAGGAAAIPEAQRPMIEGMVSKLATRLASNGGSIDEWSRLIRAYTVLHEADKAKAALVDAHKALASDASAVASLDALARNLGLGDAN